jgi:hypothetical protein
LNGKYPLESSKNKWDWLGEGVYFWEHNPIRAIEYATECAQRKQKFAGNIVNPFVLGAVIDLGNCLNLVEPVSISIIEKSYKALKRINAKSNTPMPKNKGANRALDCAVIQYIHQSNKVIDIKAYDTIRCAFTEGKRVYPTSNFTKKLHIELCVLNPLAIKSYFLPRPIEVFNPYLNSDFQNKK